MQDPFVRRVMRVTARVELDRVGPQVQRTGDRRRVRIDEETAANARSMEPPAAN
jgi:hypothetical protein